MKITYKNADSRGSMLVRQINDKVMEVVNWIAAIVKLLVIPPFDADQFVCICTSACEADCSGIRNLPEFCQGGYFCAQG